MGGNTRRKALQRKVAHALNDGDRFLNNLNYLREAFEPDHPEYVILLEAIAQMVMMAQSSLYDFHYHAWGKAPVGWEKE